MPKTLNRFLLFLFSVFSCSLLSQNISIPATQKQEAQDLYFGISIADNYKWLENTNDTSVLNWTKSQMLYTDSFFQKIPYLTKLQDNIKSKSPIYVDYPFSEKKYYLKLFSVGEESGKKDYDTRTPVLYYRTKNKQQWKELINPVWYKTSPDENVTITNYALSDDENYLAFCISRNGSDWNEIKVWDMRANKVLTDHIMWVKDNELVWFKNGFFYHKYEEPPKDKELLALNMNDELYYHKILTASKDDQKIPVSNCQRIEVIDSTAVFYSMDYVREMLVYVVSCIDLKVDTQELQTPKKFMMYPAKTRYLIDVISIKKDTAIVHTNVTAGRGMIAKYYLNGINLFSSIVPEYNEVLTKSYYYAGKLHCLYKSDELFMMVRFDLNGNREKIYQFGKHMYVYGFEMINTNEACYYEMSFDRPKVVYKFDFKNYSSSLVSRTYVKYEVNDFVTQTIYYKTADGLNIPMTLFYKKGLKINSNTPVLLSAYGGFGIINYPVYDYSTILWAENGGIYAVAHVRGGGEKGINWHIAGRGKNKQSSIDDFVSAARHLIDNKYTSPEKLAITGSSHGGLLVAAAVNQHPELFAAAIPVVGVFDMLRYQHYTVGNGFSDEFGLSSDSTAFNHLLKYSPYHNINPQKNYPAIFVMTGDHDDRVPPFHSYKYIAALQQIKSNQTPKLLYVGKNSGHNGGIILKDDIHEKTLMLAFLFNVMNIKPSLNF